MSPKDQIYMLKELIENTIELLQNRGDDLADYLKEELEIILIEEEEEIEKEIDYDIPIEEWMCEEIAEIFELPLENVEWEIYSNNIGTVRHAMQHPGFSKEIKYRFSTFLQY